MHTNQRTAFGLVALVAVLLTVFAATPAATAQPGEAASPQQLAQACIEWTQQRAAARIAANAQLAGAAAAEIEARLEAGDVDAAEKLAQRASIRVTRRTVDVRQAISERTSTCAQLLLVLGHPGLANAVLDARQLALQALTASRQEAIETIQAPFGG